MNFPIPRWNVMIWRHCLNCRHYFGIPYQGNGIRFDKILYLHIFSVILQFSGQIKAQHFHKPYLKLSGGFLWQNCNLLLPHKIVWKGLTLKSFDQITFQDQKEQSLLQWNKINVFFFHIYFQATSFPLPEWGHFW